MAVNNEALAYIKKSLSENLPKNKLKKILRMLDGIKKALMMPLILRNNNVPTPPNVPSPSKPAGYISAWDAFEHILMFLSLYSVAISMAIILHQFIDKLLPGLNEFGRLSFISDYILQGAIACLIVTLPLFIFFHLDVNKRTFNNPRLRNLKVRRVFIYITLFYTFINMVTVLVTTIFTLLQGNLVFNLVLHTIITLIITGTIFAYYFYQVKEDRKINA